MSGADRPGTTPPAGQPYPLGLRMAGRAAVVVGGGAVALRRVSGLLEAGASVTVLAPTLSPILEHLAAQGAVRWVRRGYRPGDLTDAAVGGPGPSGPWLVHACTDDPAVNAAVAAEADAAHTWCVRADDSSASAAWTPAVGHTQGLTVAVHAGGDPARAAGGRDRCVAALDADAPLRSRPSPRRGTVALVGAGPGDAGLLTHRALALLGEADVVVTDRLVPLEALSALRPEVEVVDAAKVPGGRAMAQEDINAELVSHAQAGRFVVRLKGGDPFVFGRGMEEVQACAAAGVPVTVVPGVTSAIAVPALAGIPVTSRGSAQAFAVISGHVPPDDERSTVDWAAFARSGATLVVLMGMAHLSAIAAALVAGGRAASTPTAVVMEGATPRQRLLVSDLGSVGAEVERAGLGSPAVVVIGDVVATRSGPS